MGKELSKVKIEDLKLNGFDNHEEIGFKLAIEYLKNSKQDFNELRKTLYKQHQEKKKWTNKTTKTKKKYKE